ncbi:16S rRNA (guanine(527)-N(7))-methyltransferase RsmG [Oceanicoccus sp. KOV_DT_Chl]|uniref:16S rRNA (guanine(527)-N(7))-methyltransferase RsmG n=1 Tax=Oceanicoccus sp. KOV_DT_Chl TaxID=1904639 RepID=UPI000C7E6A51|nr:16S rRNA (guanine(527)-N(7))-methyltransferase RsmG [Oceanicoccus sp. KOV_DT_Chl]
MDNTYHEQLVDGIKQLALDIPDSNIDKLLDYHQLLIKWNKAYNLTAVRDPLAMIPRHLLDSLSIGKFLDGQRFIDVGAGAGLPGIILAIIFPQREFDLLDSNGKKTRFLVQVKAELSLTNVTIHNCRVEQFHPEVLFDGVISRAFATLADMVQGSQQLLADDGLFYAMKGLYPEQELKQLSELSKAYNVEACHALTVPGETAERHLLVISQNRS